ncbi:MAG: hypothetical protein PHG66_05585 [Candidatus Colwellbacteria bacterium]|nr:hypothetical protein [Candidatus Colwellbacteria bacterium]
MGKISLSTNMFSVLSDDDSASSTLFTTPVKTKKPQVPDAPKKVREIPANRFIRMDSYDSDGDCEHDIEYGYNSAPEDYDHIRSLGYGGYSSDDYDYPSSTRSIGTIVPIYDKIVFAEIPMEIAYETPDDEEEEVKGKITKIAYPNLTVEKVSDLRVSSKSAVIGYVSERRTHQLKKKEKDTRKSQLLKKKADRRMGPDAVKAKEDRKKEKEFRRQKVRDDRQKGLSKDAKEMKKSTVRTRVDVRTVHPDIQNDAYGEDDLDPYMDYYNGGYNSDYGYGDVWSPVGYDGYDSDYGYGDIW